jgi:hypothetical protein
MAYNGWLLKVGDYIIPQNKFIKASSYSAYVNMQALDPYTDSNGYEHIDAVELKAVKVEFETPAMLTNFTFYELMRNIQANYTDPQKRGCIITAYIPEYDDYVTQSAYLADFTPQMYTTANGVIKYNSIRLAFIGGVADD